jgi:tryptophan synthase alpha chain
MRPREKIQLALTRDAGLPAMIAFITAGFPEPGDFLNTLRKISRACDAIEIGVPFSDPMADGVTIQRSSEQAIRKGVTLRWILDELAAREFELTVPVLLMSYLNPLVAFGFERLAARAAEAGVSGFMVPDLPFEECAPLQSVLHERGLALVQFVTPATPPERMRALCAASDGFVYAVTRTGITGGHRELPPELAEYLAAVKESSKLPVCAGFGVRSPEHVALIGQHADGVIVGSALVEILEQGKDPEEFLSGLRAAP